MAKKNLIIDTNVFLSDSECFTRFQNNDLFIPIKVLEELDKHKTRQDSVGFHARRAIKKFDALRVSGSLSTGVRLGKKSWPLTSFHWAFLTRAPTTSSLLEL